MAKVGKNPPKCPRGLETAKSKAQVQKVCWHEQTTAKTTQTCPWACPGKVLAARANAASQGACLVGATWTYAFFWAGRHFTEISFFGRPACHFANLLAPKAGCALKCVLWAADSTLKNSTPKQHSKASCCLWAMGLEMANSVAIAADDKFIKFIKNVQKTCNRPMNAPKNIGCM